MKISLIITIKNEEGTILQLLDSIKRQTKLPDELIIVDANSDDKTVKIIKKEMANFPIPIDVLVRENVNIAQGRNVAITQARYDVIAVTDGGCVLDKDYLKHLEEAMTKESAEVVFGASQAVGKSFVGKCFAEFYNAKVSGKKLAVTELSSRSVMFTKNAWRRAGEYPEWLTLAGEDTLFFVNLQKSSSCVFCKNAFVFWIHSYENLEKIFRVHYRNSIGDGESARGAAKYTLLIFIYVVGVLIFLTSIFLRQYWLLLLLIVISFLYLSRKTPSIYKQLHDMRAVFVVPVSTFFREAGLITGYLKGAISKHDEKK